MSGFISIIGHEMFLRPEAIQDGDDLLQLGEKGIIESSLTSQPLKLMRRVMGLLDGLDQGDDHFSGILNGKLRVVNAGTP